LHSRSAQAIHGESRRLNRQAGSQSDVASAVKSVTGSLLCVAKNRVVEIFRIEACPLDGTLARDGTQFLSRKILQLAAITSKGRTRPADNRNVPWFEH